MRDTVHVLLVGRDRAQEKQRKAEGRVHERGLHVHGQQHAEPDQIDPHLLGHRAQQRHHDEREFKVVQEEGQEEDHEVDHDQEAHLTAGQAGQQMLHPLGAVGRLEDQAEGGGANHDEHHKAGQLGGRCQRLLEQRHVQALAGKAHDERCHGTHGAAFGRRCNAQEDGTQHQKDQQQRRNEHKGHALGQFGQQAQLEDAVDGGHHKGDEGAAAHGGDDLFVRGHIQHFLALPPGVQIGHVAGQEDGDDGGQAHDHEQRGVAAVAIGFAVDARLNGQGRHHLGLEDGQQHHPQHIHAHEHEAGDEGALVHIAHALAQLVGHQNQHQRWRNDLGQRA